MNNKTKGILCIIASAFFFSLMSLFVRMAGDLPTMQKAFFRNAIAAMFAIVILSRTPEKFHIKKGSWPDLIRRSLYGTMGVILNFWAIDHIAIADASVLNKMSPFFAIIMSAIILKEKATRKEWAIVAVAFIGAVLVIKPTAGIASIPAFAGLLSGFGAGAAYTYVRKLGLSGERGPVIIMVFSLFSCIVCLPFMLFDFQPMTVTQLLILLGAGMSAMGGQLTITAAYTYAPAKEISVYDYTNILFTALWGLIAFGELPDAISICGYIIIISMAILKWHHNMNSHESAGTSPDSLRVKKHHESPLAGKTIVFLGSSVTYGAASGGESFVELFETLDGVKAIKEAVSGTTLVDKNSVLADEAAGNGDSYIKRLKALDTAESVDCVVVQLSTNDATLKLPLGEISDSTELSAFDTQTITGAMERIIRYSRDTWNCPVVFYTGARYDSEEYAAMVDRLMELKAKWGIGVIDLYTDDEFNAIDEEAYALYMADSIHPTKAGYAEWWFPKMEKDLIEILQNKGGKNG